MSNRLEDAIQVRSVSRQEFVKCLPYDFGRAHALNDSRRLNLLRLLSGELYEYGLGKATARPDRSRHFDCRLA